MVCYRAEAPREQMDASLKVQAREELSNKRLELTETRRTEAPFVEHIFIHIIPRKRVRQGLCNTGTRQRGFRKCIVSEHDRAAAT